MAQIYGQMCLEFKFYIVAITDLMPMSTGSEIGNILSVPNICTEMIR